MQEALLAAAMQWPTQGTPDNPKGWLITVATRRLTDQIRADTARRLREHLVVSLIPGRRADRIGRRRCRRQRAGRDARPLFHVLPSGLVAGIAGRAHAARDGRADDRRDRAAFLVPEATMAQRLTRAKQTIKSACRTFPDLTAQDRAARLPSVLNVLYLNVRSIWQCRCGSCPRHASTITRESLRRTDTQFGIEAGGGATAWLTSRIGLRTAATYYKALGPPGNFHGPPESDSSTRMCCVTSR